VEVSILSWVYLPFLQLICFKQLVKFSVLSGSLTSLWLASFGLYACMDLGPCPFFIFLSLAWMLSLYFFSPCLGCFLFIKFDRVSSQSSFLDYIYNVWICGIFSICDNKHQDKKYSSIMTCPLNMYWSLARRLGWGKLDALYRVFLLLFHLY
jgi:hypothetical protein